MKENGKEHFILTKTYEVSYALFRIAAQMQEKDFAESLRASATGLLSAAASEDYSAAERSLRVMECLIKFGGDVNIIGTPNTDILTREIYALDAAIAERKTAIKTDVVEVAEIFSKPQVAESIPDVAEPEIIHREPAIRQTTNDSAMRQGAILSRIRESGNCRLKEIQDILPDTSERTIRYDLQTLMERGAIQRVGVAGPAVFYRAAVAE